MSTSTVTVRNGDAGPDYDVLVESGLFNGVEGNMPVTPVHGRLDEINGTITASGQSVTLPVPVSSTATIAITGTYASFNAVFECSYDGGTTYLAASGVLVTTQAISTTTGLITSQNLAYRVPVDGATHVRLRATGLTSGTVNVFIRSAGLSNTPLQTGIAVGLVGIDSVMTSVPPVLMGGRASTAVPTAMSADNDTQVPWLDRNGALHVMDMERIFRVAVTPTITAGAYSALDQVGAVMTFTGAGITTGRGGRVTGATITDRGKVKANLQLWLFQVAPTTVADNAPFDITDAILESSQFIGCIDFLTANYRDSVSNSACPGALVGAPAEGFRFSTSGTSGALYGALVCTATPTYTSTTDLVVALFGAQC